MSYKPDYGLRMLTDGMTSNAILHFAEFPLYSLTVLGGGKYSTMVEMPIGDEMHALSLDFNQVQLDVILSKADLQLALFIRNKLSEVPLLQRTIDFEGVVMFEVQAKLGEMQTVQNESFVPFVAQEIS